MKKLFFGLATILGPVSSAFAQPQSGFSTFQISWSNGVAPAPVPTLSTYAIIVLVVLLAVVVFRASRNRSIFLRAIAPLATVGIGAAFMLMSERPVADSPLAPPIEATSCNGSATYTADFTTPPRCFVNSCGSPVTVSYTLIDGETPDSTPITEGSCTLAYYCDENGEGSTPATDGAEIPSGEVLYGTAYCEEIFGPRG